MATDRKVLRVGFMSTANIAKKNFVAASQADGVEVTSVSSRSLKRAQAWAQERNIPKAYGSHDDLLDDDDIDAVYVPLPTKVRVQWVIKAANKKKHVLCEKPVAPTLEEAKAMVQACHSNKVLFMDGVMFMHNPRLAKLSELIHKGTETEHKTENTLDVGPVRRVVSDFSFPGDEDFKKNNIRIGALEPLGSLGDLGWYNARFALFCFNYVNPTSATSVMHEHNDGVPVDITTSLSWSESRSSTFTNSFDSAFRQHASIVGSKASVQIDDFVLSGPDAGISNFKVLRHDLEGVGLRPVKTDADHTTEHPHGKTQETLMWECFAQLTSKAEACTPSDSARPGAMSSVPRGSWRWWGYVALQTQAIMEAAMQSAKNSKGGTVPIGPVYPDLQGNL